MTIPPNKPFIRRKELDAVLACLVSDKIEAGELAKLLADDLCRYLRLEFGILLSDPLVAVLWIFEALGLCRGDTIAITPLAPAYYRRAASIWGLRVHLMDTMPSAPIIDPSAFFSAEVAPALIVADGSLGFIPDFDILKKIGAPLLEDFTSSFGGFRNMILSGGNADFSLCTFGPGGLLQGGGGCFLGAKTKNASQALKAFFSEQVHLSELSDINAALILSQFREKEKLIEKQKELSRHFFLKLRKPYSVPHQDGDAEVLSPCFPVIVETGTRDLLAYAEKKGVQACPAFASIPQSLWEEHAADCPHARVFALRCVLFPMYPAMSSQEVDLVSRVLSTLP